jgi:hypothetical protein
MSEAKSLSREQWRELIQEQEAGEQTIVAFCRDRELSVHQFHYHKGRLREDATGSGFREVPDSGRGTIRLVRAGRNWQVQVERGFDAVALRELLRALG